MLSWLPSRHRASLRRLYERIAAPAARATATFFDSDEAFTVRIDGGPEIRFLPACRYAVERQFTDPEAAAELSRFMIAAADPGVLFDVGANHGLFSLAYCLSHDRNVAVAFEPSPALAETIRALARMNHIEERLHVVAEAVAERTGDRDLLLDDSGGYVQSQAFAGTTAGAWRAVRLPLTTLDEQIGTMRPTIVKMDVEGYEHEALLGAEHMLAVVRPLIFLELHLNYLQARDIAPSRVTAILSRHGYELASVGGIPRSQEHIERSWASVLHVIATPGHHG